MKAFKGIVWLMEQINVPSHIQSSIVSLLTPYKNDKEYEIKEKRKKRTLNQNAYYWKLLGQLASVLKISNDELHEQLIKRYSHNIDFISCLSNVDVKKYGLKYFDIVRKYEDRGNTFISYKVYKPSSEMNTKEFTDLVDGLISECKEVGIETLTPDELALLRMDDNNAR